MIVVSPKAAFRNPVLIAIGLFVFFLPIWQFASLIAIILLAILFFVRGSLKLTLSNLKSARVLKLMIAFYFLHLIGMLYSSDTDYGLKDLQTKLPYIIFPVLLSAFAFKEGIRLVVSRIFIAGCLISACMFLFLSLLEFIDKGSFVVFFYDGFSHWFHATYLSVYYNIALILICSEIFRNKDRNKQVLLILVFFFLFFCILLLSAKMATIAAGFVLLIYVPIYYGKRFFSKRILIAYLLSIVAAVLMFSVVLNFVNRYSQVEETIGSQIIHEKGHATKIAEENSTTSRIKIWNYATKLIGKNPLFGVGTGDVRNELVKVYRENNFQYGIAKQLNAHNQFLHTGISLGLVGMLLLAAILFLAAGVARHARDWEFMLLLLVIILNCLTESLLERQSGILLFCFLVVLFTLYQQEGSKRTVNQSL